MNEQLLPYEEGTRSSFWCPYNAAAVVRTSCCLVPYFLIQSCIVLYYVFALIVILTLVQDEGVNRFLDYSLPVVNEDPLHWQLDLPLLLQVAIIVLYFGAIVTILMGPFMNAGLHVLTQKEGADPSARLLHRMPLPVKWGLVTLSLTAFVFVIPCMMNLTYAWFAVLWSYEVFAVSLSLGAFCAPGKSEMDHEMRLLKGLPIFPCFALLLLVKIILRYAVLMTPHGDRPAKSFCESFSSIEILTFILVLVFCCCSEKVLSFFKSLREKRVQQEMREGVTSYIPPKDIPMRSDSV